MSAHLCDVTGALVAFVIDASARYIVAWKLCSTMKADEEKDTLDLALARQGSTRQLSRTGPDHYQITARPILPAIWLTGSRRRRWGTCAAQRTVRRRKAKLSACIRRSKSRSCSTTLTYPASSSGRLQLSSNITITLDITRASTI